MRVRLISAIVFVGSINLLSFAAQNQSTPAASNNSQTETPKSLAEIAREAKQKKQKNQSGNQETAAKPKVFTDENFQRSGLPTSPQTQAPVPNQPEPAAKPGAASSSAPERGPDNIVILKFELETSNIKRPGGSQFNWMLQNKSDHSSKITLTLITTGPCNYRREHSSNMEITPGSGYTDNFTLNAFFMEPDCAGKYDLELQIRSGGKLLQSASTTANVL